MFQLWDLRAALPRDRILRAVRMGGALERESEEGSSPAPPVLSSAKVWDRQAGDPECWAGVRPVLGTALFLLGQAILPHFTPAQDSCLLLHSALCLADGLSDDPLSPTHTPTPLELRIFFMTKGSEIVTSVRCLRAEGHRRSSCVWSRLPLTI